MPANYPIWTDSTPHTDSTATAKKLRDVENVAAIEVHEAKFRGSSAISGFFELVNPDSEPRMLWGSMRVEVYCAWHGVRSSTTFPQIIVGRNYKIFRNYSGAVIDNIA